MKTRKIFKIANKLVWETIWFGFWIFLVVILVSKPQEFAKTYTYTPQFEQYIDTNNLPEGAIITTKDDERVVFIETMSKRIGIINNLMILLLLFLIAQKYQLEIFKHLSGDLQEIWIKTKNKYEIFLRRINW